MTPSQNAIDLVKKFEGCKLEAYLDIGGIPTIGYGHTADVHEGDACTEAMAEEWLMNNLQSAADCVLGSLSCALTQNELDALACFTYNVGCANFKNSSMHMFLSRGDYQRASQEFPKWDHVKGVVVNGLLNRRLAEQALFTGSSNEAGA